jgi:hypothetical protein
LLLVAVSNAGCRDGWLNAAVPFLGTCGPGVGWTPVAVLVLFQMVPVRCQRVDLRKFRVSVVPDTR